MLSAISAQWPGVVDNIGTLPCFPEALKERYLPFLDQKLKKLKRFKGNCVHDCKFSPREFSRKRDV